MKKHVSSITNFFLVAAVLFLLFQRVPAIVKNFKIEGSKLPVVLLPDSSGNLVNIVGEEKRILIFWVTWCVPCKIELARYKKAIEESQISAQSVFAINIGEDAATVFEHSKSNAYPFVVLADVSQKAAQFFEVSMTPTVVFLEENGTVNRVSSGISLMPISLAKSFLGKPASSE